MSIIGWAGIAVDRDRRGKTDINLPPSCIRASLFLQSSSHSSYPARLFFYQQLIGRRSLLVTYYDNLY